MERRLILASCFSLALGTTPVKAQVDEFRVGLAVLKRDLGLGLVIKDEIGYSATEVQVDGAFFPGLYLSGRRFLDRPQVFLEMEATFGSEERVRWDCGGFDCVSEQATRRELCATAYLGWLFKSRISERWSIGGSPRGGFGMAVAQEDLGADALWRVQPMLSVGAGAEVEFKPSQEKHTWITISGGVVNRLPVLLKDCDACWRVFRDPSPQGFLTVGVGWG